MSGHYYHCVAVNCKSDTRNKKDVFSHLHPRKSNKIQIHCNTRTFLTLWLHMPKHFFEGNQRLHSLQELFECNNNYKTSAFTRGTSSLEIDNFVASVSDVDPTNDACPAEAVRCDDSHINQNCKDIKWINLMLKQNQSAYLTHKDVLLSRVYFH